MSVGNELIATTAGIPNIVTFSICLARLAQPIRTASGVVLEERRVERLAGHDPADATVHLERPDRGDHDGRIGRETRRPALDIEELLGAHVGAEAGFGADDLVRGEGDPVGDDRVVAVGDVGERPGVDEGRPALEGLEQVRLERVAQQHGHRAGDTEVLGGDRRPVRPRREHHPSEPGAQILEVRREGEDGHHLRGDRDHELGLARDAVLAATEPDDDVAQRAVADVDDARPEDAVRVDAERVLVVEAVVDEGAGQVVGGTDRVHVTGQVEVEILHRDDLAVATAGRAALDPEHRARATAGGCRPPPCGRSR